VSEKKEREIILDLSKKIKFYDKVYISVGSLILSSLVLILQGLTFGWSWGLLYNFVYSIRSGRFDNENNKSEDNERR